ncbi:MAG: hypothetical protein MO853_13680 [Candidatus Protistobacter heckmanni]|nr:hypothetical protein [Candidatus Protistobacter heckmanni]
MSSGDREEELEAAAHYFSALKPVENIVVKEAAMVPTIRPRNFFFAVAEDGATEPIGQRIVEIPETLRNFEFFRDDRVKFIAYMPPSSITDGPARAALKNKETGLSLSASEHL